MINIRLIMIGLQLLGCIAFGGWAFFKGHQLGLTTSSKEIQQLRGDLEAIEITSKIKLQQAIDQNKKLEEEQTNTIKELEIEHAQVKQTNNDLATKLASAQLQYRASKSKSSSGCSLSKDNSSARSKEDDDRGRPAMDSSGLPEGFDSFVSGKALQADQIDEDKHVILKWLNSLPKEVIDVSN